MAAPASGAALFYAAPRPRPITIEVWGSILHYISINHTIRPGPAGPSYPLQETPASWQRSFIGILCITLASIESTAHDVAGIGASLSTYGAGQLVNWPQNQRELRS